MAGEGPVPAAAGREDCAGVSAGARDVLVRDTDDVVRVTRETAVSKAVMHAGVVDKMVVTDGKRRAGERAGRGEDGDAGVEDLGELRWTVDLENSLENLLVSYKFNFNLAAEAFNKYLEQRQRQTGCVIKKQHWSDLTKKWSEIQKRKHGQNNGDASTVQDVSDLPEELKSQNSFAELD